MPNSWKNQLSMLLNRRRMDERIRLPRTCLIGIGSDLRGDDSAGLLVVRSLLRNETGTKSPHLLIVEAGPVPENHTGKLRAFNPELVLLIDAAHMGEVPGAIQWISLDAIDGMSASTHSLPLSMVAQYIISEFGCNVAVLGIQAGRNEFGAELTIPVRNALNEIVEEFQDTLLYDSNL